MVTRKLNPKASYQGAVSSHPPLNQSPSPQPIPLPLPSLLQSLLHQPRPPSLSEKHHSLPPLRPAAPFPSFLGELVLNLKTPKTPQIRLSILSASSSKTNSKFSGAEPCAALPFVLSAHSLRSLSQRRRGPSLAEHLPWKWPASVTSVAFKKCRFPEGALAGSVIRHVPPGVLSSRPCWLQR